MVPLMVKVCAATPAVVDAGESVVIVGTRLFTVKLTEFEALPPGMGFVTTTGKVPAVAWSPTVSWIVNFTALTNAAMCATPL